MKRIVVVLFALALALPLAAETWKGVALMDAGCAKKADMVAHPENHPRACALQCAKAGFGVVVDGKFIKFDAKGDELAADALKKSEKKDHLNVTISGEMKDGTIAVTSLALD